MTSVDQAEALVVAETNPETKQVEDKPVAVAAAEKPKMRRRLKVAHPERCIGCLGCMFACSRTRKGTVSLQDSAIKVQTQGGIEGDFRVVVCRGCEDPPCARACAAGALEKRPDGRVVFHKDRVHRLRKMRKGLSGWRHLHRRRETAHQMHPLWCLCGLLPPRRP